jgi:hypothetical protein
MASWWMSVKNELKTKMSASGYMRSKVNILMLPDLLLCSGDSDVLEREQNIRIYRMITRKIPTFEARIPAFIEHPEQLNDLSSVVRSSFIRTFVFSLRRPR